MPADDATNDTAERPAYQRTFVSALDATNNPANSAAESATQHATESATQHAAKQSAD